MAPPSFSDLNKSIKDLLDKNYNLNKIKFEHKGKTSSGIDLNISANHDLESKRGSGHLEAKYKFPEQNATLTEKWMTNSTLVSTLVVDDRFYNGMKNTLELSLDPNSGKKTVKAKLGLKTQNATLDSDMLFSSVYPTVTGSLVMGGKNSYGILLGAQGTFDTVKNELTKLNFGCSLERSKNLVLSGIISNSLNFEGAAFHRINSKTECGAMVNYNLQTHLPKFAVGVKHALCGSNFVKTKVDSSSNAQLAYVFKLSPGFNASVSGQVDLKNINAGNHSLGMSLEFEP